MSIVLAAVAAALLVAYIVMRSKKEKSSSEAQVDSTPALEAWINDTLEIELAEGALGIPNASVEEPKRLAKSLRGEPDPDVVTKIEDKVRDVELEYTRYAH